MQKVLFQLMRLNPLSDPSSISHYSIKGLSVREVMRIENMGTQVKFSITIFFWQIFGQIEQLFPELLKALSDPSDEVRIMNHPALLLSILQSRLPFILD